MKQSITHPKQIQSHKHSIGKYTTFDSKIGSGAPNFHYTQSPICQNMLNMNKNYGFMRAKTPVNVFSNRNTTLNMKKSDSEDYHIKRDGLPIDSI